MQASPEKTLASKAAETTKTGRPWLAHWPLLRAFLRNRKAMLGVSIMFFFVMVALLAPWIAPGNPKKMESRAHLAPAWVADKPAPGGKTFLLGTTGQGQDVFRQLVWGSRLSLTVGLSVGIASTILGTIIGLTAGYLGGWVDDLLSLLTNVMLIIPGMPLLVILAAFLKPGPVTVVMVLTITGWAWPARVMRSQVLSLRAKDFIAASVVSGERTPRILFSEVLPNMSSVFVGSMVGSTVYAIGADVGLAFLGLTDVGTTSWGTMLYWAQNNAGILTGAWWTFVPTGICIALCAFALTMLNYALDEITNPRLRAEKETTHGKRSRANVLVTPVIRK